MNKTSLAEAETLLFVGPYSGETGYSASKNNQAALLSSPLLPYLVRVGAAPLSHTRGFLNSLRRTAAFLYSERGALVCSGSSGY